LVNHELTWYLAGETYVYEHLHQCVIVWVHSRGNCIVLLRFDLWCQYLKCEIFIIRTWWKYSFDPSYL